MDSNLRDVAETAGVQPPVSALFPTPTSDAGPARESVADSEEVSGVAPTPTPEAYRTPPTPQEEEESSTPTPTEAVTGSDAVSGAEDDSSSEDVSEDVSVSGAEAESMPAPVPVSAPRVRTPSLAPELILRLDKSPDLATAEANLARLSEAYHRGDNRAIADALIEQAHVLQVFGIKALIVAAGEKHVRSIETYTALGLRALEQARKTLTTLHGLRDPKPRRQTNVQVNLSGPAKEVLEVSHEE